MRRRGGPVVLAGTFAIFRSWCWENGMTERDAFYVRHESDLRGMSLTRSQIRYAYGATSRPDILELETYIHMACSLFDDNGDVDWLTSERGIEHQNEWNARANRLATAMAADEAKRDLARDIAQLNEEATLRLAKAARYLKREYEFADAMHPSVRNTQVKGFIDPFAEAKEMGILTEEVAKPVRGPSPKRVYIDEIEKFVDGDDD